MFILRTLATWLVIISLSYLADALFFATLTNHSSAVKQRLSYSYLILASRAKHVISGVKAFAVR